MLGAALAHAAWNAIAHRITDKFIGFTLVGLGSAVCTVPLLLTQPLPHPASWPYLLASAMLHVAYIVLLMRCYRLGDFNQVYPLARGTAPPVVAILAALFAGEHLPPFAVLGVLVVSAGLGQLIFAGGLRVLAQNAAASVAAVGTGLVIAAYTTVDGLGVRASGSVVGYTAWLMLLVSLTVPSAAAIRYGRSLLAHLRPVWHIGMLGGALSLLAYGLVLWAQANGPLAPIAALRETSIIMGAIIGALFFREPFGRTRLIATTVVAGGIAVLQVAS